MIGITLAARWSARSTVSATAFARLVNLWVAVRNALTHLNAPGINAPRGGQWHATSVRNVMARA
jgi:hypothetical protein